MSGPAGTGKSRACLEKVHLCAEKYAGMRGLIVRQTRKSLTQTALKTYEQHVRPDRASKFDTTAQSYKYPNGSELVVGGLDKPEKIMSSEYDLIYLQEATDSKVDAWEALTTRLRNGVMPYQQLLADCNPNAPSHWLKQRADKGATHMFPSLHEDNPLLFDQETGELTIFGASYIATLDALTGVRKDRLRYGRWAAAEGAIYEHFRAGTHVIPSRPVPRDWNRYWTIDFGYTNPFVWQDWARSPDGTLYLVKEIYRTQRLVQDHARDICQAIGAVLLGEGRVVWTDAEPKPRAIICDHDAEDRATLERWLGLRTVAAQKSVSPGIQVVSARLRLQPPHNAPRLYIFDDALEEIDESLLARSKPFCTAQEFDSYVWDRSNGRKQGEEPVKEDDHGMDALRYQVAHHDFKDKHSANIIPPDMKQLSTWAVHSPIYVPRDNDDEDDETGIRRKSLFKVGR